ncbi:MAG: hypothetical protein IPG92_06555 [Flavobacteriales bacterium]|nr:hypothetical protein [Flavobacteriales bacterium]
MDRVELRAEVLLILTEGQVHHVKAIERDHEDVIQHATLAEALHHFDPTLGRK